MASRVVDIRLNRRAVDNMLRGRHGLVVTHLASVTDDVAEVTATQTAPRSQKQGEHLADNIESRVVPSRNGGYEGQAVATVPWAVFVHRGTKPHDIGSPVNIEGVGWRYIGRSPRGRGRRHPGTKANPFFVRAARRLGLIAREIGW